MSLSKIGQVAESTIEEGAAIVTDTIQTGTKTTKSIINSLLSNVLSISVTALSMAFVGIVSYTLYRTYYSNNQQRGKKKKGGGGGDEGSEQCPLSPSFSPVLPKIRSHQMLMLDDYKEIDLNDLNKLRKTSKQIKEIEKILDEFKLSTDTLKQIMDIIDSEMDKGLDPSTNGESTIKMLPTHVCHLPTGKESNDVLALDLGGSSFRVLLIQLRENEKPNIIHKVFIVSESTMKGFGTKLFDHISSCLHQFMIHHKLDLTRTYPLGFTFSFPCLQTKLSEAILLRWTKGFDCSEVVGKDVVKLLQSSIDSRKDIKVKVTTLINDTVGILMSCAYDDPKTAVGIISGTGTNACYIESMDKIASRLVEQPPQNANQMIVNTEWGAFGENSSIDFIRSTYDTEVDKTSINVGKQIFEKMVSGMYLGELVRLIILEMIDSELILVDEMKKNSYRHALFTKGSLYSRSVNEIELDASSSDYAKTRRILKELAGIENASRDDCAVIKYICNVVTERSAKLTAAGLAVILKRLNRPEVTIAVDGSLFRYHIRFNTIMDSTLKTLANANTQFKIVLSDGSGRGAAIVAAVAAANDPLFK